MGGFHQMQVFQRILFKRNNCLGLQDWFVDSGTIATGSTSQVFKKEDIITVQCTYIKKDLMLLFEKE